jgi:hypothetical protein
MGVFPTCHSPNMGMFAKKNSVVIFGSRKNWVVTTTNMFNIFLASTCHQETNKTRITIFGVLKLKIWIWSSL